MLLSNLLAFSSTIRSEDDCEIKELTSDSREVSHGSLFVALSGQKTNGEKYIDEAIARGAKAILVEASERPASKNVPIIRVPNLNAMLPDLAERFYGVKASGIALIGVTGTNGKTSCTHFLSAIYQQLGIKCGILGTLGWGFLGKLNEAKLTTPGLLTLYRQIHQLHKEGATHIAMEVSSHAIHQSRIAGLPFKIGAYTNLTQDHLDYHGTMENYAAAKYQFLAQSLTNKLAINQEDNYGKLWIENLKSRHPTIGFATKPLDGAALYASDVQLLPDGMKATINTTDDEAEIILPLLGLFNLSNALAVIATLLLDGYRLSDFIHFFNELKGVPGRLQLLGGGDHPLIAIDYAHTPDALEKVLLALRAHTTNRLICVFGCGGDRDKTKRPMMGKIAAKLADFVILTNDNPRSEDPLTIIDEIKSGMPITQTIDIIPDRSKAIQNSIQYARKGDVILIAGKGAERFQHIGNESFPFQDEEVVRYHLS